MEDTVLQKSSEIKEGCKMIESDDKRKTASTRQGGTQRKGGGKIISSAEHEMGVKIKTSLHLRCPLLFPFVCFLKFAPSSFISLRPFSLHFFISFRPIYLPSSGRRLLYCLLSDSVYPPRTNTNKRWSSQNDQSLFPQCLCMLKAKGWRGRPSAPASPLLFESQRGRNVRQIYNITVTSDVNGQRDPNGSRVQ